MKSYSGLLRHACNSLGKKVFWKDLVPGYVAPLKYTGQYQWKIIYYTTCLVLSFECRASDKKGYL